MSELIRQIGQRIRNYRVQKGFSQERLAELSGCHPTYIGQIERGEKNATLESIEKISSALKIPLSTLFEKLEPQNASQSIPLQCYELLLAQSKEESRSSCSISCRQLSNTEKKNRSPDSCRDFPVVRTPLLFPASPQYTFL